MSVPKTRALLTVKRKKTIINSSGIIGTIVGDTVCGPGDMHSFLIVMSCLINKDKLPQPVAKVFLVRWLPSVKTRCTNCTALGTRRTYVL